MDIAAYISELLKDHNEVSLPGIGIFYKKRISAVYDKNSGSFSPPFEELAFKSGDPANSELIDYISAEKKISKASARYFVNKYSESIKQSVASEGQADLSPVGVLFHSENGLYMKPSLFSPASFGMPPLKDLKYTQPETSRPVQVVTPEEENIAAYNNDGTAGTSTRWRVVAIVAALLLALAGLAYVFYPEYFNLKSDQPAVNIKQTSPAATTPVIRDTLVKGDSVSKDSLAAKARKQVAAVKKDTAIQPAPETIKESSSPRFEIIGASFTLKSEAETYIKYMHSKGIKATMLEDTHKPKFKVSLGSYPDYEKANEDKRKIQKSFNSQAWIYTITAKDKVK